MKKYVIALDQGTTSSRAVLIDKDSKIIHMEQKPFTQIFPKPGWVEHNINDIWETQVLCMLECLVKSGVSMDEVDCVGITNQRETVAVWDRYTGQPVSNAICWQCRRTAPFCRELIKKGYEDIIFSKTGLVTDAYFSGSKIKWILDNVEGAREKAENGDLLWGTVDSWLLYKLTGGKIHATDSSNASRTMLFNINTMEWDKDLINLFEIPESMFPKVLKSSGFFGMTDKKVIGYEIPVCGIAGDQQAALFGQACFEKGDVKNTYGTGCFILMNTGSKPCRSENRLISSVAWDIGNGPVYALEGSVFNAGSSIQWLRDSLKVIDNAAQTEKICESLTDTGGVYVVPAFTGLGAPYWDMYARGTVLGLTRGSGKEHIIRATCEAICYQSKDVLEAMERDSGICMTSLKVDGGASVNNFLMQFQSDILQKTVIRPVNIETTALGAAYLAGLATGFYKSRDEIKAKWSVDKDFTPVMDKNTSKNLYRGWKKAVERAKNWEETEV